MIGLQLLLRRVSSFVILERGSCTGIFVGSFRDFTIYHCHDIYFTRTCQVKMLSINLWSIPFTCRIYIYLEFICQLTNYLCPSHMVCFKSLWYCRCIFQFERPSLILFPPIIIDEEDHHHLLHLVHLSVISNCNADKMVLDI